MNMLAKAIALASDAFKDTFDRGGSPYILHCLRVMGAVNPQDPGLMSIAVLHDMVEDKFTTLEALSEMGFSLRIVEGVDGLTHRDNESYEEYLDRLSKNSDCVEVKKADLKDNTDITRLKGLREKDFARMVKYHKAWVFLNT